MSIALYSAATIDSLLAGKLSISSLSNAATSTLDATAPTAGQALTFDGTNLVWATVGGGGGGASWGSISGTLSSQTDLWTALSALAPTAGPSFTGTVSITGSWGSVTIGDSTTGSLALYNGSQTTTYAATGITFADGSVQNTAPGPAYTTNDAMADGIAMRINYFPFYNYQVQFDFSGSAPVFISNLSSSWGITDGSTFYPFSYLSGNTAYFSSSWSSGTFHVQVNGHTSGIPLPY